MAFVVVIVLEGVSLVAVSPGVSKVTVGLAVIKMGISCFNVFVAFVVVF